MNASSEPADTLADVRLFLEAVVARAFKVPNMPREMKPIDLYGAIESLLYNELDSTPSQNEADSLLKGILNTLLSSSCFDELELKGVDREKPMYAQDLLSEVVSMGRYRVQTIPVKLLVSAILRAQCPTLCWSSKEAQEEGDRALRIIQMCAKMEAQSLPEWVTGKTSFPAQSL